ncbi:ficolin-1-like [Zophobas morio]|uniref:ficolin-1-like n=1 Tax=Zophobas morio TaxID=2755281 RepID=UPI00308346A3
MNAVKESGFTLYSIIEKKLTETKNEVLDEMSNQRESTKLVFSESEKHITGIESYVQTHFTNLENQLKETKQQIVAETKENVRLQVIEAKNEIQEVETALQTKFKIYDTEIKNELDKAKKEIVTASEQQLSLAKDEIFNRIASSVISTKLAMVSQNEKQLEVIQSNLQIHFEKMKNEISALLNFKEIKNQLRKTQVKIITEIQECKTVPSDCREIQRKGYKSSGIYRIQPMISLENFLVCCDMSTRGGGWTYVLNRFDGSQNFYLNWTDYKQGFGNLSGEHWLGLDHLYQLTNSKPTELLFELMDWDSKTVNALYNRFQIGNETERYQIKTLGLYDGNAGDSFDSHDGSKFSTADNDHSSTGTCASSFEGGWWYTSCLQVDLSGKYIKNPTPGTSYQSAINWNEFHGYNYSLKEARMMIRTI